MSILAYSEAGIYPYFIQIEQNRQFGLSKIPLNASLPN